MSHAPEAPRVGSLERILRDDAQRNWISDRISSVLKTSSDLQLRELKLRNSAMQEHALKSADAILGRIAKHHCAEIMRARASEFRRSFSHDSYILDLGGGTGWYWHGSTGPPVVLVDFSLESLKVAERLLAPQDQVILIHGDAADLPFRPEVFDGLFSVQVLQHMQASLLAAVCAEISRIMKHAWRAELYSLHAPLLHRAVYALLGRAYHREGELGDYYLTRQPPSIWNTRLSELFSSHNMSLEIDAEYSELFFHPNFHCIPKKYPTCLESFMIRQLPTFAGLIARQHQLRIKGKKRLYT
ncbi:MAG: class I SAM-dependent methyltransferase [Oligoflexia bacterium]|nr:class I SAM-dependent methyltransferase [Oligoflexia bacterium]